VDATGPEMYATLRTAALDAVALGLPAPPAEHPTVSGVVVDVPAPGGFVTIVAMGEGSTSMYASNGGGVIGAGGHASVARTTHALLAGIEPHLTGLDASDETSHPPPGLVRLFVLTPTGRRVADAPEDAFWGRLDHPLGDVLAGVQSVVSALREAAPQS
jgi:hypothetical protein